MVYFLATATALVSALDSTLQRIGVESAPPGDTLRVSLVIHALKRGVWLLGFAFVMGSFLLQAVALHLGNLSLVQPILTTELLFLVLILATWFRFKIGWREWLACLAAAGGLAGFLVFAEPSSRAVVPTKLGWIVAGVTCGGTLLLAVFMALRGPRWWRAAMFGTAGAVGFAFTASLIKAVGNYVAADWIHMFVHWQTYGLAVCGLISLFLAQNAFHAGPITASQTAAVIVNPLASLAIGIGIFGDNLRTSGAFGPLEASSLVVMFIGAASLARTSFISGLKGGDDRLQEMLSPRSRLKGLVEAMKETPSVP